MEEKLQRCSVETGGVQRAGGLLGSGRLLARYLARMLEVYCKEKRDRKGCKLKAL